MLLEGFKERYRDVVFAVMWLEDYHIHNRFFNMLIQVDVLLLAALSASPPPKFSPPILTSTLSQIVTLGLIRTLKSRTLTLTLQNRAAAAILGPEQREKVCRQGSETSRGSKQ